MEFEEVDYEKSPMSKIRVSEIRRLDSLLFIMERLDKLCDRDAHRVAIEFGFKGDIEAVRSQLIHTLDRYALQGMKPTERLTLRLNEDRVNDWFDSVKCQDKFYKLEIKKAITENDMGRMSNLTQGLTETKHLLHNKKECVCFTN